MKWREDFHDSLRNERHDEATQSSLAALDAEETNLEDRVRAQIVAAIEVQRRNVGHPQSLYHAGMRVAFDRAEKIASGVTL